MKKIILCILDGCGVREESYGNAFKNAKKPTFDYLWNNYPHSLLEASGQYVGLPEGQMGNSEVGHSNIGAGRILYQSFERINNSIKDGSFYKNNELLDAINKCKKNNTNLHICGMVSDGGVHSHINHLFAILDLCKKENFNRVYIHIILDGRDTLPKSAREFLESLNKKIEELNIGTILTIGGRYYLMNRDRDWPLTEKGYNAVINGISDHKSSDIITALEDTYTNDLTDEFMLPTVIKNVPVENGDSLILFNFRSDRMIQFLRSLTDPNFKEFKIRRNISNLNIYTMTEYENLDYEKNVHVIFKPEVIKNSIGEYISNLGYKQIRISEAEKRGHITFYFSGCNDKVFNGEDRIIYDKDDVFTYDEKPDMRSSDITNSIIESTKEKDYSLIVVNYPNGDALGHTGNYEKTIEGIEDLDKCLNRLINEINLEKYTLIITADHGNCEYMKESDGTPNKSHTTSLVPFIVCDKKYQLIEKGKLGDIAPTMLKIMGLDIPKEMTGNILIKIDNN